MMMMMMMNSTEVSYFILGAYFDSKLFKYFFFLFIMFWYVLIVGCNVVLIVVICVNRSLHEPMYMFLCSLFVNELYGSTGLFPFLLIQILSDVHTVAAPLCFLQVYCLHSYVAAEFYNLTILSYDRYLAICYPLQYASVMTVKKVGTLVAAAWLAAFLVVVITVSLSFSLQLCDNIIHKVYCDNYSIVKLACSDITFNNIYGLLTAAFSVYVPFTLIIYTYLKIFKVCFSGSKQTRQKAVSTCTPHLASLINFLFGVWFEVLQSRLNMSSVPSIVRIVLSLYFLTCPPLFNPLIYGLKLSKIRDLWKSLLYIRWR